MPEGSKSIAIPQEGQELAATFQNQERGLIKIKEVQ